MEKCNHDLAHTIAKLLNQSNEANILSEGLDNLIHEYFLHNSGDQSDCESDEDDDNTSEAEEDTVVFDHLLSTIEVEANKGELDLDPGLSLKKMIIFYLVLHRPRLKAIFKVSRLNQIRVSETKNLDFITA